MKRPRYLRAIPSLVVLTTAMAWGALPDRDDADDAGNRPETSVSRLASAERVDAGDYLVGRSRAVVN